MPNVSFSGLLIVTVVAFLAPLLLGLSPARRLPAVVLEIVAGIVIGPAVLGWVKVDLPISILSVFGLAFLLFLAGLEPEARGHRLRCLHPGLFCGERAAVRPGRAVLKLLNPVTRAHLPGGVTACAGCTGLPLPPTCRQSSFSRRGTPAGDIAFLHRGGIPDRSGAGTDYEGDGRGSHRRWAAVSPHLPAHGAHALAPQ